MVEILAIAGVALGVLGWAVTRYNVLARLRNRLDNAAAQIDVHLRRRHDLVSELITHDPSPDLAARLHAAQAAAGAPPPERAAAEATLAEALVVSGLDAAAAARLHGIDTQIRHACRHHNETVRRYDQRRGPGPAALVARLLGAGPRLPFVDPEGRPIVTDLIEPNDPTDQESSHG